MPGRLFGCITEKLCAAPRPNCSHPNGRRRFLRSRFDMDALLEILSPHFFLRNSMYVSVVIGLVCPLAGVYLVLRRLVLLGVALPQISSSGVAVTLSLPLWLHIQIRERTSNTSLVEHILAFVGATVFSLVAILILAWLERRGRGWAEGRLATTYAVAGALSILLLSVNRFG